MPGDRSRPARRAHERRVGVGVLGALLAGVLTLVGCSGNVDLDTEEPMPSSSTTTTPDAPRPILQAVEPSAPYSLIAGEDASEFAIGASRTYLDQALVAVIAPADEPAAVLRASSLGRAIQAPVLLTGGTPGSVDSEIIRLGVVGVITVGAADLTQIDTTQLVIAPAPDDVTELGALVGVSLSEVPLPGDDADPLTTMLGLGEHEVFAVGTAAPGEDDASESSDDGTGGDGASSTPAPAPTAVGELPPMAPPVQVEGSMLLTDGDASQLAAVATAGAAGADVLRVRGDIRASATAIETLADAAPTTVVGLGDGYGDLDTFEWRAATAATGVQLPGGSQLVFHHKRYVALYGSPITSSLGLLGEQGTRATVDRAAAYAARYDDLTDDTVVPALEIIVTVASGSAGDDGNYSQEWGSEEFVPLIEAAADAGQYVVLDFQPGRSSFLDQVRQYEDLLAYPNVGIALDPEWRLGPDELPLQQIGSVGIDEVNATVDYLADFVRERALPQKMVILHQFQLRMIEDRQDLDTSRSEVALLIHADGQGSQGAKQATWRALHEDAPEGVHWGWKNFVDEDSPMLNPRQTYAKVDPVPDFVSYQ